MKRSAIRADVEAHLAKLGFARSSWLWQPAQAELILTIEGTIKTLKLKSGMSHRALTYELGRIAGWAEFAGIEPRKPNGAHAAADHSSRQPPLA